MSKIIDEEYRDRFCAIRKFRKGCRQDCRDCTFKLPDPATEECIEEPNGTFRVVGHYNLIEEHAREMTKKADIAMVKHAMKILYAWCKYGCKECSEEGCPFYPFCEQDVSPMGWMNDEELKKNDEMPE